MAFSLDRVKAHGIFSLTERPMLDTPSCSFEPDLFCPLKSGKDGRIACKPKNGYI